jgi:nucleotide-binding universal stress UspA family protein/nitroimidazol reductase NimA-like FMN-containing flavoprotein (pyridoxamine 5'-phosphate oxidase superfamily)
MSGPVSPKPRILLATDFSASAAPAAEVAREEAKRRGARLHVLHVVRSAAHAAAGRSEVTAFAASLATEVPAVPAVREGNPASEIVRYAEEHEVELIVVGGHGRTGLTQALLGSVAERVARTSTRPVLLVPLTKRGAAVTPAPVPRRCIVCGMASEDLVCEPCRANIRATAGAPRWAAHAGAPAGALTREECEEVLRLSLIGRLACHAGGRLYVIPMAYCYDEGALYLRFADGLKVRMIRADPAVCLEVDHILDLANWRSVIVWGTFRELHGEAESDGLRRIMRRLRAWAGDADGWPASSYAEVDTESGHRALGVGRSAVVGRIEVTEMTGRYQQSRGE